MPCVIISNLIFFVSKCLSHLIMNKVSRMKAFNCSQIRSQHRKMRLFLLFLIIAIVNATRRRPYRQRPTENRKIGPYRRNMLGSKFSNPDDFDSDIGLIPVPFGHIYREGIEDPTGGYKQAVDPLELHTIYLKDGPYARDLIKTHKKKFQPILKDGEPRLLGIAPDPPLPIDAPNNARKSLPFDQERPPGFPNDQNVPDFDEEDTNRRTVDTTVARKENDTVVPYWNFEAILKRNIDEPPKYRLGGGRRPKPVQQPEVHEDHGKYFSKNSYALYEKPKNKSNSTTCDEFGKNAKFHPNDIVNINWVPFFVWTNDFDGKVIVSRIHHFKYPTKKLVKQYRDNFGPYLNHSVDWEQPKLFLKAHTVEALLIAVDRTGLFYAIPFQHIPLNPKARTSRVVPLMKLRLKIVDPYLAMMYCSLDYATIMAVSGTEPNEYKKCISESAVLKFRGPGLPVRRDLVAEANEAKTKTLDAARREAEKYIPLEDF